MNARYTARSAAKLSGQWIGPRPWQPTPPADQPNDVIIAAMLRNVGMKWDCVAIAMEDGAIGPDGWFEVLWNGVTIRFPVKPAAV